MIIVVVVVFVRKLPIVGRVLILLLNCLIIADHANIEP